MPYRLKVVRVAPTPQGEVKVKRALEIAAIPVQLDDRAARRRRPVLEGQRRARALQQGLGDEKPEAEPVGLVVDVLDVRRRLVT